MPPHIELGSTLPRSLHKILVMCLNGQQEACRGLPSESAVQIATSIPCQVGGPSFDADSKRYGELIGLVAGGGFLVRGGNLSLKSGLLHPFERAETTDSW